MSTSELTRQDKEFVEKLTQIVLNNLNNEQFGVTELSKNIGYSRSYLHRKINAINGHSISQFIREVRLQEAYKLLRDNNLTASEISYRVGFNNPSYFNTCFHEYFGFTPGEAKHRIIDKKDINIVEVNLQDGLVEKEVIEDGDNSAMFRKKITSVKYLIIYVFAAISLLIILFLGSNNEHIDTLIVLPPYNYTGQSELDYFISGMHSSLIGEIGRLDGMRVISEVTSKSYKNSMNSLKEIAKEVNVKLAIEPSVFCLGDSICIQLKLIRINPEEKIIWVNDFKVEKSTLFDFYNQFTKQMANEVNIKLSHNDELRLARSKIVDTDALDAYMKGLNYLDGLGANSLDSAKKYFNIANQKDPDWALPYAGLSQVWAYQMQMQFVDPLTAIPKIYTNLNEALEKDPYSSNSHYLKAIYAVWMEWNWEKGEEEFEKAIELNPNHALCRMFYAHFLMIQLRNEEALKQANYALELDPLRPFILALYAKVLMNEGDYKGAKIALDKALTIEPEHHMVLISLQQFYKVTGDYERWFKIWKSRNSWRDEETLASIEKVFYEKGYLEANKEIIKLNEKDEKAGIKIADNRQAMFYLEIKNYEKAIEYLCKAYDNHNSNLPYASTRRFDSHILKNYPEYVALMKKMRLPVEE